ncbi:phage terminase small subunit [Streptomyces mauvecolor]
MPSRRGPAPNPNARRRNTDHALGEHGLSHGSGEGRALPKALAIETGGAKRFWRTWASAPQTEHWLETDWAELELTTRLVDAFYQGNVRLAGEIRQRVGRWGATTEDRARLRMNFDQQTEQEAVQASQEAATDLDEELFKMLSE